MAGMLSFFSVVREPLYVGDDYDGRVGLHCPVARMDRAHRHDELEFNLALNGTATYLLNDRTYKMRRNTVVWIFPEQDHILLDISDDYEMWIAIFRPALVERICTSEESRVLRHCDPEGIFAKPIEATQANDLSAHFERTRHFKEDRALYNAALGFGLLLAWKTFQTADCVTVGSNLHPSVEAALRLTRKEGDFLSIPEIARESGLSQSRLSRLFRMQTGLSLTEFRNRIRIERFQRMYGAGSRISMLRAALEAGFGSYPQFHRVFRQVVGVSPQQHYRRPEREPSTKRDSREV
jgi:AraC-like DNA-binding protein